jgi:hypothetical protein
VIRGRLATIKSPGGGDYMKGFEVYEQEIGGGPKKPVERLGKPVHTFHNPRKGNATYALYENFLECVRARKRDTLSTPELGAAAFTTVNMGVLSYRQGRVLFWDKDKGTVRDADASWAARWQERSKKHGKPSHILGWEGGDSGSVLEPPAYQKLAGPWVDGKDPAAEATSAKK